MGEPTTYMELIYYRVTNIIFLKILSSSEVYLGCDTWFSLVWFPSIFFLVFVFGAPCEFSRSAFLPTLPEVGRFIGSLVWP
jgi:hypothetical protein